MPPKRQRTNIPVEVVRESCLESDGEELSNFELADLSEEEEDLINEGVDPDAERYVSLLSWI